MVREALALQSFSSYADGKLLEFANGVVTSLTGNPLFTTLGAKLDKATEVLNKYSETLSASIHGNASQVAAKNTAKAELIDALRSLCIAVNDAKRGNREALYTSGFQLSKEVSQPSVLTAPKKVTIKFGASSGELNITVQKGTGTRSFLYEYTADAEVTAATKWQVISSTESRCTLTDLTPGKYVWIRVGVVGTRRQYISTDPVRHLVA